MTKNSTLNIDRPNASKQRQRLSRTQNALVTNVTNGYGTLIHQMPRLRYCQRGDDFPWADSFRATDHSSRPYMAAGCDGDPFPTI